MQNHRKTITLASQIRMKIYTERVLRWVVVGDVGARNQSRLTLLVVRTI